MGVNIPVWHLEEVLEMSNVFHLSVNTQERTLFRKAVMSVQVDTVCKVFSAVGCKIFILKEDRLVLSGVCM